MKVLGIERMMAMGSNSSRTGLRGREPPGPQFAPLPATPSWDTLQEPFDEHGQHEWDLRTTIYSATKERSGPGEHYWEGFISKRMSYATGERTSTAESMREAGAFESRAQDFASSKS